MALLEELKAQVAASEAALVGLETGVRHSRADRDEAARDHATLAQRLEREEWIAAQVSLGIDPADIDADRRIVTSLPVGPVYVVEPHPERAELHARPIDPEHPEAETVRRMETV